MFVVALGVLCMTGLFSASPAAATGSSVLSPAVTLSTTAAGAPGVTYDAEFTTSPSGALTANSGTITVALPTGTVIPNQAIILRDAKTGITLGGTGGPAFSNNHATATWTVNPAVPAVTKLQATITGVTNAPSGSAQALISTSSDSAAAGTSPFNLTAPKAASSPSATLSTTVQAAKGVSYTVDFTASSTGELQPSQGTITLAFPAGTTIPNQGLSVTDLSTGQGFGTSAPSVTGSSATYTVFGVVPAGDRIELQLDGVTNPSTGGTIGVSTSSDPTPVNTPAFSLAPAQQVSSPNVVLSTRAQAAKGVSYTVDFTASSTGELQPSQGTITLAFPAGTTIPNQGLSVTDLSAGQGFGTSAPSVNGSSATYTVFGVVPAGDRIELQLDGVTNPSTGGTIGVSTSSDPTPVNTPAFSLVPAQRFHSPTVALSTRAQAAKGVSYTVDFTASSTGELQPSQGTITLAFPAGTGSQPGLSVTDLSTGQGFGTSAPR